MYSLPDVLRVIRRPGQYTRGRINAAGALNAALMSHAVMEFLEHIWAETDWED